MAANRWHMRVLSKAWRYGLAVISCGIALAVAIPFDSPSSCFFLAVMVSARRARRREQALFLRATASQEADINAGYDLTMADQYKPGDRVPRSGIYRVIHDPVHCQEHEVTCVRRKKFPTCNDCGGRVRFELARGRSAHRGPQAIQIVGPLTAPPKCMPRWRIVPRGSCSNASRGWTFGYLNLKREQSNMFLLHGEVIHNG